MIVYRRIYLTEREVEVFLVLDRYRNREVDRRIILNEANINISYLARVLNKLKKLGVFDIGIKYENIGLRKIVRITIIPKYKVYKIVDDGSKKILWIKQEL